MTDGREYAIIAWCKNRDPLGDQVQLKSLLHKICSAIEMRSLGDLGFDVPLELHKRDKQPFEDEGGSTAMLVLTTSHAAIHGWPRRDDTREDGGLLRLNVSSCRDFNPAVVDHILHEELNTTSVSVIVNAPVDTPQ